MKPNWLPDWTDESQYPDPVYAAPGEWAWEFLRRNQDYQRLWQQLVAPNYSSTNAGSTRQHPGRRTRLRLKPDELEIFLREFHLVSRPPPSPDSNAGPVFETDAIQYEVGAKGGRRVQGYIDRSQMVVWLDFNWPIQPQLKNAKAVFEAMRKRELISNRGSRARANKYHYYLRVLDAAEYGVPLKSIAAILYPKLDDKYPDHAATQKVRDDHEAAKRLRDHDYWRITLSQR